MKLLRPLLLTLGILGALLALAVGIALVPGVQGWAVRRVLAGQPGLKVEFASVAVTPWSLRVAGVRYEQDGLIVAVDRVESDFSAWQFLVRRRIHVDRLAVAGVAVDATKLSRSRTEAGAAGAPAAAPGALARVQLPWIVELGDVQVSGRATLSAPPGRAQPVAEFQLTGGGIAPAREGVLQLKSRVADATPGAPVTALRVEARLMVRETESQTFDHASVTLAVDAEGPQFSNGHQLTLAADMQIERGAENYALSLDTRQAGHSENVLKLSANVPAGGADVSGKWALSATDQQIEPFFLGAALPNFRAAGEGAFTVNLQSHQISLRGALTGNASALETIDPALRPLGTVQLETNFDLVAAPDSARLNQLKLRVAGEEPALAVEALQPLTLTVRDRKVALSAAGGAGPLAQVEILKLPLAWLRPFIGAVDISGGAVRGAWTLEGQGEQIRLRATTPLTIDNVTVVSSGLKLLDRASLKLNASAGLDAASVSASVSDFSLRTPAGDEITAEATVRTPFPQRGPLDVRAQFAANLPKLLEPFAPVGHVRLKGEVDATQLADNVDLRTLRAELADGQGRPLVTVAATQPGKVDLTNLRWQPANPAADVARLELAAIDFAQWPAIQALVPLRGQMDAAVFNVSVKDGRLLARMAAPLRLRNLSLNSADRRPALERASLTLNPSFDFGARNDWKFSSGELAVANADAAPWLTSTAELKASTQEGLRAAVTFNADLAAMAAQPMFAALSTLSSGRASGEIRAAHVPAAAQVEGRVTLNNLVLRDNPQPLPVANLGFRVVRTPDRRITIEAPLLLDRLGQRSDLKITAEAVRRADGVFFDAKVAGEHLELADALALVALGGAPVPAGEANSAPQPAVAARTTQPAKPDARAFWAGLRGEVALDVKSITRGKDWAMTNLGGYLAFEPDRISMQRVQGLINEKSRLGARADLRFNGGAMPYRLSGNFSLTDFDAGAAMKAFDPGKPPVLEGIFTVAGGFTGDGANLDQTIERTRGQFQLTSRQGIFRGLKRATEKVSVATKTVDAVAAIGSLFGGDKIKGVAEKVAGSSYQVDQLAQALAEIPFDQLVVRAQRDDALNLRISEFSLLSPEVRLIGQGSVTHVAGKPLLDQPLAVSYQLAARGKTEQLLGKLRMLDGAKDDLGYAKMKDLGTITGTLNRPDPSAIFVKLAQSKLIDFLN